jgi:RNA polymerase sigma-70 factor (ECF subfamily)
VASAQGGDVEALNELFTRYYGYMVEMARRRLGRRLRVKEEADDLAQTTFREAVRDFGQYKYRGEGSLLRWLVQILQNKIRDKAEYYAAGKRDVSRERSVEDGRSASGEPVRYEPSSDDLSVTRQVQREEEFAVLREALEELSPDHRRAITLVFFQGLTLREAGSRMDRSEDAVRMLLRRAEARLRELTKTRLAR